MTRWAEHDLSPLPRPPQVRLVNYKKSGERFLNDLSVEPLVDAIGQVSH